MDKITLANVCGGGLEEDFQQKYKEVVNSILPGQKGTISMQVSIQRIAETSTMTKVEYSINSKRPTIKKSSICQIVGNGELLLTEVPEEKEPLKLFKKKEA
jgi:hypothetical protein